MECDVTMTEKDAYYSNEMQLQNQLITFIYKNKFYFLATSTPSRSPMAYNTTAREKKLTPVLIPTMSKDMEEQLKRTHKVVDVVDGANRNICVTLLRYNVDKPESSYAQFRFFAWEKEDEKKQQVVYVNYTLWKSLSLYLM